MIYRAQSHSSWDIKDQNIQKDVNSPEIWQNFSTSNPNISETVSHSITKFHFLREREETFQTYIYINHKNGLRFFADNTISNNLRTITIMCTAPFLLGMRLNLLPSFQKGGAWQDLIFRRDCWERGGGELFLGSRSFYIKKLNPEIFNEKKFYKQKHFITKNLNWEILTKNLVTFKRWDGVKDEKKGELLLRRGWYFNAHYDNSGRTLFSSTFCQIQRICL